MSHISKKQGQSTTEYLLVTLLASVFVFALAARMSPELQTTLDRLEDVVALKLAGGKLLGHVQETEGARFEAPVSVGEVVATPTEATETADEGAETVAGVTPQSGSASGDPAFLEGSQAQAKRAGQPTGEGREFSEEPLAGSAPQPSPGIKVRPPTTEVQQSAETAKKKAEDDAKSKGRIYREGEEGEIFGAKGFNWLRLLIILLIIILVAYIGFEIFKGIKSTRTGR
ncbi:MAG: hypothetical protein AAB309_06400 [Deltaproteobacteria bacterium]